MCSCREDLLLRARVQKSCPEAGPSCESSKTSRLFPSIVSCALVPSLFIIVKRSVLFIVLCLRFVSYQLLPARASEQGGLSVYIFGRAKRAPHWGVQSRFRVIYTVPAKSNATVTKSSNFSL